MQEKNGQNVVFTVRNQDVIKALKGQTMVMTINAKFNTIDDNTIIHGVDNQAVVTIGDTVTETYIVVVFPTKEVEPATEEPTIPESPEEEKSSTDIENEEESTGSKEGSTISENNNDSKLPELKVKVVEKIETPVSNVDTRQNTTSKEIEKNSLPNTGEASTNVIPVALILLVIGGSLVLFTRKKVHK